MLNQIICSDYVTIRKKKQYLPSVPRCLFLVSKTTFILKYSLLWFGQIA